MSTDTLDAPTQTAEETTNSGSANISGSELFQRFRTNARSESTEETSGDLPQEEPVTEELSVDEPADVLLQSEEEETTPEGDLLFGFCSFYTIQRIAFRCSFLFF